ncbi:IclR family transcriptional regulator [Acinetobacter larvae]|uniref:IclR family transcriptional regulator n=1 Tax=Acinetobacter larvae TaxID=1789224 RepID=UPI0009D73333|nr:IclR family transcriptional regulator C-terminal domain-containing protein [Acinetobacter larvae]
MALSSFGKILTVLNLYSTSRPVIHVDIIAEELGLSRPTSYRYLKELVAADLLQRIGGTSGDYVLGPKIAVLDYISRTTDPMVEISAPFMKEIAERTELCCLLTFLNRDYCLDIHHEVLNNVRLFSYGRGCPRPVYMGASPKMIMAHLHKSKIVDYYQRYAQQLQELGFAEDEQHFVQQLKKIKKQAYVLSRGEIDPNVYGLAVPIHFSNKDAPLALTVVASKNRFEYLNIEKLVQTLQQYAAQIEKQFQDFSANSSFTAAHSATGENNEDPASRQAHMDHSSEQN